jgi:hypothetical protein
MVTLLTLRAEANASAATDSMIAGTAGRKLKTYWLLPGSFLTTG